MTNRCYTVVCALLVACCGFASAGELRFGGVLANSGESGETLVRFGDRLARGLGGAVDCHGRLWDRAGRGTLNCYAPDGRLVRSVSIDSAESHLDQLAIAGDSLVLFLRGHVWTLPVDAGVDVSPTSAMRDVQAMSADAFQGCVAVQISDLSVHWFNPTDGSTEPALREALPKRASLTVAPDGRIFASFDRTIHRFVDGVEATDALWPRRVEAERLQCFGDVWFGHAWHSTIKRYDVDLNPAPGVVLGGASGSFIGFLPESAEIVNGRGMCSLGKGVYAVSGLGGVMHLLRYDATEQRMRIVRRIGALTECPSLTITDEGYIWAAGGAWPWDALPDAPMSEGTVAGDPIGQAVLLSGDIVVGYAKRHGKPGIFGGPVFRDGLSRAATHNFGEMDPPITEPFIAAAAVNLRSRQSVLLLTTGGSGRIIRVSDRGEYQGDLGIPTITLRSPVTHCTSLGSLGDQSLLLGADGHVIVLAQDDEGWHEAERWNHWGDREAERFGDRIALNVNEGRLWVSDTSRHRVIVFEASSREPLGVFGVTDTAGDSIDKLNAPQAIAAAHNRAVVYDAGNQRLVRMELMMSGSSGHE